MMNGSGINDKLISFGHVNAFAPVFIGKTGLKESHTTETTGKVWKKVNFWSVEEEEQLLDVQSEAWQAA